MVAAQHLQDVARRLGLCIDPGVSDETLRAQIEVAPEPTPGRFENGQEFRLRKEAYESAKNDAVRLA